MPLLELAFASAEPSISVRRFSIHEALSSPFTVSLWVRSDDPSLDLSPLVGHPASFRAATGYAFAQLGGGRLWTGIVSYAEQIHAEPSLHGLSTYYFRIVPTLWLLTRRRGHRIFQHQSIPDIVDQLLGEWGIEPTWKIERARYPKLELKVQYDETDYVFLSRLLEEAGITFTFAHDDDAGAKLTFTDAPHLAPPRAGPPLLYVDNPNQSSEQEFVTRVRLAQRIRPGAHTIRAHDFRNPAFPLFAEAPRAGGPEARYEQYHYRPGAFLIETAAGSGGTPVADDRGAIRQDQRFGVDRAERALLGERMDRRDVSFETNALDLGPGTVFSVDRHPHPDLSPARKLLVAELAIEGTSGGEWTLSGRAAFAEVPYRPPLLTQRPEVVGVQSATVVGPKGQEIHTDEFGRVRVQFPWDREGELDERSSCWIRVSQGWAGAGYGMLALPRVGQEVLVSFLEGDPDQPVVVGRVYNQTQPVPQGLPPNKTISTWKSDSSPGSGGFNEIRFEDRKGDELVYVQAEKNLRKLVKNDETITVLHDRRKDVAINETDTTGVNRIEVTGGNRAETTEANRLTAIGGGRAKRVKRHQRERTEGNRRLLSESNLDAVVKRRKRERIESDVHLDVRGKRSEQIDESQSLTVGEDRHEDVGQRYTLGVGKQVHLAAGEIFVGEAATDVTIKGPGGFIRIDAGGVIIKGTVVDINVGGTAGNGQGARPAPPEEPPDMEATWIEIVLNDGGQPPRPVPFQRYRVESPDGTILEGALDADGKARVAGVSPGVCKVTFLDLDEQEWF